jgi:diguanylate cyclase (GGDEF)-like protein
MQSAMEKRTNEGYKIIENIYNKYKNTLDNKEIIKIIRIALSPIRFFNGRGYFFITDMDGTIVLNPTASKYEGKHYSQLPSSIGVETIKKAVEIMQHKDSSFYTYLWPNNSTKIDYKKMAYMKKFKPLNFFIGTAEYFKGAEDQLKAETLEFIKDMRYGQTRDGYFYVLDSEHQMLMHPISPSLKYQNMETLKDADGFPIVVEQVKKAKTEGKGFVSYKWLKPSINKVSPKISYVETVPGWDWIIVSGLYVDDVETNINKMRQNMKDELIKDIIKLTIFIVSVIIIFIIITIMIKKSLKKDIDRFVSFFERAAESDKEINREQIRFAEFYDLAFFANKMLKDKLDAQKKLVEMATTDSLTGAYNRRYFSEHLNREYSKAKRYNHFMSLMILDIDHFKKVNDTYGHIAGDIVLKEITRICKENLRGSDIFSRIGGEEFATILPSTSSEKTYDLAERIRRKIEETPIRTEVGYISITVSIGVADVDSVESEDPFDIYKMADSCLYEAKDSGRNRVISPSKKG